jgi:hypothetical protein
MPCIHNAEPEKPTPLRATSDGAVVGEGGTKHAICAGHASASAAGSSWPIPQLLTSVEWPQIFVSRGASNRVCERVCVWCAVHHRADECSRDRNTDTAEPRRVSHYNFIYLFAIKFVLRPHKNGPRFLSNPQKKAVKETIFY